MRINAKRRPKKLQWRFDVPGTRTLSLSLDLPVAGSNRRTTRYHCASTPCSYRGYFYYHLYEYINSIRKVVIGGRIHSGTALSRHC